MYTLDIADTYDTAEDTLVVTIEKTTKTGKASNAKDFEVSEKGQWPNLASQGLAAGRSRRFEFGASS